MADQLPLGSPEHALCLNQLRALASNDNNPTLTPWERIWIRNQEIRLDEWGESTLISHRESSVLDQLVKKLNLFVPPAPANNN